jgi:uncharacterized protein (TIGR03382 family)
VTGRTAALHVLGNDDGGESTLLYKWSASGPGAVSFAPNDANAAKNSIATFARAGVYTVTATLVDADGMMTESIVSVTVSAALSAVELTPKTVMVASGAGQQFTATARDQFGDAIGTTPAATWAVSGGGTIDAAGLFTARTSPGGPFTVSAVVDGVRGTALVTIDQAPAAVGGPSVQLMPPGAVLSGEVALTAAASDDIGIAEVTFFVDSLRVGSSTESPFTVRFDSRMVSDGTHVLVAEARDTDGNVARAEQSVQIRNDDPSATAVGGFDPKALGCSGAGGLAPVAALLLIAALMRRRKTA